MGLHCETCDATLKDRKNRFCHRHALQVLRRMERDGYLQPLTVSTVDGANQKLSDRRFLTVREKGEATEMTSD